LVGRWARDNERASQCINAKAETLSNDQRSTRPSSSADVSYPLTADTGPKNKRQPLWIHPRSDGLMLFAGLCEFWYPEPNQPEVTFTIVTCAANAVLGEIHVRMPVILDEGTAEDWINPREKNPLSLKRLLVPTPSDLLVMQPAAPLANSVKNEGPSLLKV
jgi:putative SOS response-associated peptidase YedK